MGSRDSLPLTCGQGLKHCIKNVPRKKFTQTQLRVTDIHESDDTLEATASTTERTTAMVLPEAESDNERRPRRSSPGWPPRSPRLRQPHQRLCWWSRIPNDWWRSSRCGDSDPVDDGNAAQTSRSVESWTETWTGQDGGRRGPNCCRMGWDGVPGVPNAPNEASQSQDPITTRWLTPYSTAVVRKSQTDLWTRYARGSTATATDSPAVDLIMSNTRSLFWTPSVITKMRHSDRQQW